MKRHITLIIGLMAVCVIGVIGLQLFWNYQNYKSTVKNFDHNINEALRTAADRELDQRQQVIVKQVARWMSDTSFIQITTNIKNRDQKTVFDVKDRHPYKPKEIGFSMSINNFKQKLPTITPWAKKYFIDHFVNNIVRRDLKKGSIYYYTQRLGDSLEHAFFISKLDLGKLNELYAQELRARNITANFVIRPLSAKLQSSYLTQPVNTSMRRPYEKEMVKAGSESPDNYFLREMKWVVIGTLLLIMVILICFGYTTKTLLSQHKLAELKNDFINNMTHELNTPLASIKITVEALNSFTLDPERVKDYLGIINYQTDKLTDLTTQILNANKLVRLKEDTWEPVNLKLLIKSSIDVLSPQILANDIRSNLYTNPQDIFVKGEPSGLQNVISNIIDNALKYNRSPKPTIDIQIHKQDRFAKISIADNGPGIPQEYRERIFEQFFRIPQGNQHDVKGYGLGLSYVKQVIQAHHGKITVGDNDPQGSIFTIQLPWHEQ